MGYDVRHRRPIVSTPPPVTGTVVRADDSGVWVAPLDGDTRHPLGPCMGAGGCVVDDIVLLIQTDQGPWVAGRDS
jgi:hypothetical protein